MPGASNVSSNSKALDAAHAAPAGADKASPSQLRKRLQRPRSLTSYKPAQAEADKYRLSALLWLSGISLLLVPMATLLDVPIARWFHNDPLPHEAGKILDLSLIYAHGSGIFLILLAILMMAPKKRWKVPRLATLALGGGAVATLAKMFVLRPRPNSLKLDQATYDHAWIWSFDWTLSRVADFDAGTRAFPSAYLATATALTVGLWIVVPRGRPLFLAFCVGTMLQRIHCGAHFLSDLFGSAAAGLSWCYVCYHPSLMGTLFDKMEAVQPLKRPTSNANTHTDSSSLPEKDPASQPASLPRPAHFRKPPLPSPLAATSTLPSHGAPDDAPDGAPDDAANQKRSLDGQPNPDSQGARVDPPSPGQPQDKPSRHPKVA